MQRIIATFVLSFMLSCGTLQPVYAQATPARINIVASGSITDLGGTPIVTGKLSVIATNDQDSPVKVNVAGQQQAVVQQIDRPISNGSLAQALLLPNPAVSTPAPLRYRITIRNNDVNPASITVYKNVDVEDDGTGNWDLGHYLTGATTNPAAQITFKVDGVNNVNQTLLNLKAGSHITLADDGSGGVTISGDGTGTGSSITLKHDGTNNGSQTILNLKSGTGLSIADDGSGGLTITPTLSSVNGKTGAAVLAASDVGADPIGAAAGVQSNLNAEATTARAAESANATAISNEETNRGIAVSAEATARSNADAALIPLTQKGVANGVADLDSNALVPLARLPNLMLKMGLIAYHRFSETSGTSLIDYSGNGNNGTVTDTPTRDGIGYAYSTNTNNVNISAAANAANTIHILVNFPLSIDGITPNYSGAPFLSNSNASGTGGLEMYAASGLSFGATVYSTTNGSVMAASSENWAGTHVVTISCVPAAAPLLYLDGNLLVNSSGATASCNNLQTAGNYKFGPTGRLGATSGPLNYTYYGAAFYSTVQDAPTIRRVVTAMLADATSRGVQLLPTHKKSAAVKYVAVGDSLTCGAPDPGCTTGSHGTNGYQYKAAAATNKPYTVVTYGVPGITLTSSSVMSPYTWHNDCESTAGVNLASFFLSTNEFQYSGSNGATVSRKQGLFAKESDTLGCKPFLIGMLSRTSNASGGVLFDQRKNEKNAEDRAQWKNMGFAAYVDLGSIPGLGADGDYANPTLATFYTDGTHLLQLGYNMLGAAVACAINGMDGSSPNQMNPVKITAAGTATCADGGRIFDASAGAFTYTLESAQAQSGRQQRYCNNSATGSNAVTLAAPADFPFNNISGSTTISIAQNTCATVEATWNGHTDATTGSYWRQIQ